MAERRDAPMRPARGAESEQQSRAPAAGLVETGPPPVESLLASLAVRPALVAVPLLAALAFVLRVRGYSRLSLWQDEGWTVSYARLPWPEVLGLRGQYDAHPPLFFAAAKLAATVVPEADAGRLVSVIAGTLTVLVLYALVVRLAGHLAAACAALVLAVAPLHVWYSQEARMYALAALLVALSYLALVAFAGGGHGWWALVYGLAVLLAMYVDYSALFPLAPQVLLLLLLLRWHGRRALLLWLAVALAALAFLPWVPEVLASLPEHAAGRDWYLGVSPSKVADSVLTVVGLPGYASYYWGPVATPWAALPNLGLGFLLAIALAALTGGTALARRVPLALAVALVLGPGTIAAAALASLAFPGYADRTVLYAALGWAILAGAAPLINTEPWHRQVAVTSLACVVALSAVATQAVARDGKKQDYRALAGAVREIEGFGLPLLTDGRLTDTFLDLYGAEPPSNQRLNIYDPQVRDRLVGVEAVWFAYAPYAWNDHEAWQANLAAAGFARVGGQTVTHPGVPDPLHLDLYSRPTARLGMEMPLPASFTVEQRLPAGGTSSGEVPLGAVASAQLIMIRFATQSEGTGHLEAMAGCLAADGRVLPSVTEDTRIVEGIGAGSDTVFAARCPDGTTALRLAFHNGVQGEATIRDLQVATIVAR